MPQQDSLVLTLAARLQTGDDLPQFGMRIVVVLPQPDGPISATVEPSGTSSVR